MAAAAGSEGITWPVIDGHVLPDDQYKMYEAKRFNDTPILVGYNSDEGLSFGVPPTPDAYRQATRQRYGPYADRLLAAYPTDPDKVSKTARDLTRDAAFGWATWSWARLQAKYGKNKAYLYYFDQHPNYPADSPQAGRGSAHGSEISVRVPASERQCDRFGQGDLRDDGGLLDELRQEGRPQRSGRPRLACLQRQRSKVHVFLADRVRRTGAQPGVDEGSRRVLRVAADGGRDQIRHLRHALVWP